MKDKRLRGRKQRERRRRSNRDNEHKLEFVDRRSRHSAELVRFVASFVGLLRAVLPVRPLLPNPQLPTVVVSQPLSHESHLRPCRPSSPPHLLPLTHSAARHMHHTRTSTTQQHQCSLTTTHHDLPHIEHCEVVRNAMRQHHHRHHRQQIVGPCEASSVHIHNTPDAS